MTRLERLEKRIGELQKEVSDKSVKKKKKKEFKLPFKVKSLFKQSSKKQDYVLVQYLTQHYTINFRLCRVVSGNIVVIGNKAHKLNPKKTWHWKKYTVYIIREIDREPVSNEDVDEVEAAGNGTSNDVVLIKAVMGAVQKDTGLGKKANVIGIIIGLAVAAFVLYIIFGGA